MLPILLKKKLVGATFVLAFYLYIPFQKQLAEKSIVVHRD